MNRRRNLLALLVVGALIWGGYLAYRAHMNLVTLDVRNMEVRKVVSKIEWQTWERILVNKGVTGLVTLNVRDVPLEEVLNIVGLQTSARWTALYPIYSTRKAGAAFQKVVRGDLPPLGSGWMNLQKAPLWQRNGGGVFGNTLRAENKLVSAQILNKDLGFATLALSRFTRAQVVPEDSAKGMINLKLQEVRFEKAVAQLAKQVHRKWDQLYALQPMNNPVVVARPDSGGGDPKPVMVARDNPPSREQETEAFLATMTPEERKKTQEQIAAAEQMQSLPPGERQQRMQEMSAQAKQASQADQMQRIQNRLKNGTPQQRVEQDRRKLQKPPRAEK